MKRSRYLRIVFFFAGILLNLFFWEILLRNIGLRRWASRGRSKRLTRIARNYRKLAINMGGVLIKVGQFLSARADILPEEITDELSGLQDEVPAEDFGEIRQLAESELGGELLDRYERFEEKPFAAASLGQVHRAKLKATEIRAENQTQNVVVKVQRPNIEQIIATDVAALSTVGKWVMRYRPVRERADVPALLREFTRILYEEIDYLAEGANADLFAEQFENDEGVRIPSVYWTHTTRRVLTLEDVFAIKITDYEEISAAGIDRGEVAKRLFDVYMQQIFEEGVFHADPHPGNLFVEAGEKDSEGELQWKLTFVDFGMVGRVPPNARKGLRELAIAVATQDAQRMVRSYQLLNVLLPAANLDLIAEAEKQMFDRFWGKSMEELRDIPFTEMHDFAVEFRELVYAMPFQVPHDLIFLARTVAILAGMCTGLDPAFNLWERLSPYAEKLLAEEGDSRWGFVLEEIGDLARKLIALPRRMDSVLEKMESGKMSVQIPQLERSFIGIEKSLRGVIYAVLFLALLTNGVLLEMGGRGEMAVWLFWGAGLSLIAALFSGRRSGRG